MHAAGVHVCMQAAVQDNEQKHRSTFLKWKVHSAAMRGKFQVSRDFAPWTTRKGVCLQGVPPHCHRVRDVLDLCFIEQLQQKAKRTQQTSSRMTN